MPSPRPARLWLVQVLAELDPQLGGLAEERVAPRSGPGGVNRQPTLMAVELDGRDGEELPLHDAPESELLVEPPEPGSWREAAAAIDVALCDLLQRDECELDELEAE